MKKSARGFTLVELLVVVAIIAILSTIGLAIFGNLQARARDSRRSGDLDSIRTALETAHANGTYPALTGAMFSSGNIPVDPRTSGNYIGVPFNGGTTYNICADLEADGVFTGANSDICVKNQQ